MNKIIYTLLALTLVSCGGTGEVASTEEVESPKEEIVDIRYGVDTKGYELKYLQVKSGETMGDIMTSFGRTARDIDRVDRASAQVFPLNRLKAGEQYVAFVKRDDMGVERLEYIAYEQDPRRYVLFVMSGDSVSVQRGSKPTKSVIQGKVVMVESSIWNALNKLDMPYNLGEILEDLYSGDVDFFGLRRGDRFTMIYDEQFVDDSISVGIVAIRGVKFVHRDTPYYAIAYNQSGKIEFWDEKGASLRKSILKAPLKYSRITSRFSETKATPVYRIYLNDKGVEYAAPTGTAVHAVLDGVVTYRGADAIDNSYTIKIQHKDSVVIGYHNLRRFVRGVNSGSRVVQGDIVGYVGALDKSDNPHLDYRMWVNGEPINPHSVAPQPLKSISAEHRAEYDLLATEMVGKMDDLEAKFVQGK